MKVLYISARQSWPPVSGAKLRDLHLARGFGDCERLSYVFFADPAGPTVRPQDLPFCHDLIAVPRPDMYTPGKILHGILRGVALPIVNYSSPEMNRRIEELCAQHTYDLIYFDSIHLIEARAGIQGNPKPKFIYNWHNIESELMARYGQGQNAWPKRVFAAYTAPLLAKAEDRILRQGHGHIVCSERERRILLEQHPGTRIEVIENGVDSTAFADQRPAASFTRLVFVGSMSYHANIDAAVWFVRHIWPTIHQHHPQLRLTLVGSDPVAEVRSLAAFEGVEVTGTVPDVRPYYDDALAAVVPIRVGGGTRLKILEAMAARVPVISTALGAEGLAVTLGSDILFAEQEPAQWLVAIAALLDPLRAQALAASARRLIESRYDWRIIGQKLARTCETWILQGVPPMGTVREHVN